MPVHSPSPYQADELLLLTKDGKGCVGTTDPNACFASKTLKYSNVDILVKDADSGLSLQGIPITMASGMSSSKLVG